MCVETIDLAFQQPVAEILGKDFVISPVHFLPQDVFGEHDDEVTKPTPKKKRIRYYMYMDM